MSRGPGHIERTIRFLFENDPDAVFTIDELCWEVYANTRIEKKHTVAVLRAVRSLIRKGAPWEILTLWTRGMPFVVYNPLSVTSYSTAKMMQQFPPGRGYVRTWIASRLAPGIPANQTYVHALEQIRKIVVGMEFW
jgi:hypothetical protein